MPVIIDGVSGTLFGNWKRIFISVCTGIVIPVTGAIWGIHQVAPITEPYWYTSHGESRRLISHSEQKMLAEIQKSSDEIQVQTRIARATQLDVANGKREASAARLAQFKASFAEASTDAAKSTINYAIQKEQDTLDAIDAQIKSLKKVIVN